MSLRDDLQRLAKDLADENDTAYTLWTWLPSYKAASAAHGDYAGNFAPSVGDTLREALKFISHELMPTGEQRDDAGDLYACPCGEPHEERSAATASATDRVESDLPVEPLSIELPRRTIEQLHALAAERHITLSQLVLCSVRSYVASGR